jgi:hypothetical protein
MNLLNFIIGPRWLFRYPIYFVKSHNHVSATWRRFCRKTTPIPNGIGAAFTLCLLLFRLLLLCYAMLIEQ